MLKAVSLGPGDMALLTPAARWAIEEAEVVAGYKAYIDLVPDEMLEGKIVVSTGMMGELDRARQAVEHARAGRKTVMVCSGDAGIYAMAGLLMEVLESEGLLEAVPFEVIPGVAAFNAAAALLGAPLMHDFASISLSDLLTPWERIEQRLQAAASADFVIALYNPRSKRRSDHLREALDIIGQFRRPGTPVGIVRKAYRVGQFVEAVPLREVDVEKVDMQTVLIVGNSATRLVGGRMLTPRGYHRKYAL
ncbi:precorrin-3B C(17)-methyltransferase [Desulfovibrio sp. Huiquan2017]|uniref:precorrin-3B C(17)-methyltransferase n=1 Tax=Desulfovibrio sp. Huiquan2017 TaxID=2816861 RepID=UPI001A91B513